MPRKRSLQDKVIKTTQNAFINYFNSVRRLGGVSQQDKVKLLILWFFYFLKYRSDFLYDYDLLRERDIETNEDKIISYKWHIDRNMESYVNKKFNEQINCLLQDSCFIKLIGFEECYPMLETIWSEPITKILEVLATNATYIEDVSQIIFDDASKKTLLEQIDERYGSAWYENSNLMIDNDSEKVVDSEGEETIYPNSDNVDYLTPNKNRY